MPPEEKINQSEWSRLYYFDTNSHSMCPNRLNIFPSYILCSAPSFISFIGQESKWLLYQYISYIKAICQLNYSNTFSQYGISQRSNSIVMLHKLYKCPMWLRGKKYSEWQSLIMWREPSVLLLYCCVFLDFWNLFWFWHLTSKYWVLFNFDEIINTHC